jgi:hypothetical protein
MERWLLAHGAREVSIAGRDRLYALPSP